VSKLTSLPRSIPHPPATRNWVLLAARDFGATLALINNARRHSTCSAEHVGSLIAAVISYARPFSERADLEGDLPLDPKRCFLDLALDLGASLPLHRSLMLTGKRIIAQSQPRAIYPPRSATEGSKIRICLFDFPDIRWGSVTDGLELGAFVNITRLMRLACVFLLAEIDPAPLRHRC
jgi:hypothetical protein